MKLQLPAVRYMGTAVGIIITQKHCTYSSYTENGLSLTSREPLISSLQKLVIFFILYFINADMNYSKAFLLFAFVLASSTFIPHSYTRFKTIA